MTTIINNEELELLSGDYAYKTTGALDLQIQLGTEGFHTLEGGSFTGVNTGLMTLPTCTLKVINGSTFSFIIKDTKSF